MSSQEKSLSEFNKRGRRLSVEIAAEQRAENNAGILRNPPVVFTQFTEQREHCSTQRAQSRRAILFSGVSRRH